MSAYSLSASYPVGVPTSRQGLLDHLHDRWPIEAVAQRNEKSCQVLAYLIAHARLEPDHALAVATDWLSAYEDVFATNWDEAVQELERVRDSAVKKDLSGGFSPSVFHEGLIAAQTLEPWQHELLWGSSSTGTGKARDGKARKDKNTFVSLGSQKRPSGPRWRGEDLLARAFVEALVLITRYKLLTTDDNTIKFIREQVRTVIELRHGKDLVPVHNEQYERLQRRFVTRLVTVKRKGQTTESHRDATDLELLMRVVEGTRPRPGEEGECLPSEFLIADLAEFLVRDDLVLEDPLYDYQPPDDWDDEDTAEAPGPRSVVSEALRGPVAPKPAQEQAPEPQGPGTPSEKLGEAAVPTGTGPKPPPHEDDDNDLVRHQALILG